MTSYFQRPKQAYVVRSHAVACTSALWPSARALSPPPLFLLSHIRIVFGHVILPFTTTTSVFPSTSPPPFSSHVLQGGRDQSLTFEGRELVDRKTLDQYNIKIGSRLMQQPGICVRAPAPALLLSCSCYKACIHACQHFHDAQ